MKLAYKILKGYKYMVYKYDFVIQTNIKGFRFVTPWYSLNEHGELSAEATYCRDGPTDPGIDTKNFMIGSLTHDVLYQAMREGHLPRTQRKAVDQELRRICLENGMSKIRAWYVYHFVRIMGKRFALPEKKPRGRIIEV